MRTAVDTDIISALWSNEPTAPAIAKRLSEAKRYGALLVSGVVYCELLAHPQASSSFLNEFRDRTGIAIEFQFEDAVWQEAGRRFANYAERRRRTTGNGPKRLLADFLVGAHALLQADRLMTLDERRYREDFPDLTLYRLEED